MSKTYGTTSIDSLIAVVKAGGTIKTGVDVRSKNGLLLLNRDVPVSKVRILEIIKKI